MRTPRPFLHLAFALALWPGLAAATGLVAHPADPKAPDQGPAALLALDQLSVTAALTDTIASITETRTYAAAGYSSGATLRFYRTLRPGTEITSITWNGEPLAGHVVEASEADELRKSLTLELHDPASLRDTGRSMWVSEPVTTAAVSLWESGWVPLVFEIISSEPLTAHGTMRGISLPVDWHKQPVGGVTVDVTATTETALRTLYAPYHTLTVDRTSETGLHGTYTGWQRCTAFDVLILLSTGTEPFKLDLLANRDPAKSDGTFMALLSTSAYPDTEVALPRDVVVVADRSGSMAGEKMSQAVAALDAILDGLGKDDRFALVSFSSDVTSYKPTAAVASPDEVLAAHGYVAGIVADGGTNIHDALSVAFDALPADPGHPRYIVFLTDGLATSGNTDTEAILSMVRTKNEVGARVFPFGIGDSVNTVLLDRLADESGGRTFYIRPGMAVDTAVATFFAGIAAPALIDPVLDLSDFGAAAVYPESLDDLFAGQTVVVLGSYTTPGEGTVVLSGTRNGAAMTFTFDVSLPESAQSDGYVPRVWATRRIGGLLEAVKLGSADPTLVDEAIALANRYGVITEFTYFVLQENGDTVMTYSEVPVDVSGSTAVSTSSTLDSYQKGGTVDAPADTWLRYLFDRTFPSLGGWFTDTAMNLGDRPTNLTFGSDRYFELLARSSDAGGYLGISVNVRFELLGQPFRVTDTVNPAGGTVPAEADLLPELPVLSADEGAVSAVYRVAGNTPRARPGKTPASVNGPGEGSAELEVSSGAAAGCSSAGSERGSWQGTLGLLVALALLAFARRRA